MRNDVITLTIGKKLIANIDKVRKTEARASWIRRAIEEKLERDVAQVILTQPVEVVEEA